MCKPGKHQIVAEADGAGASKWGRLSTGGWISLDYATKIEVAEDMDKAELEELIRQVIKDYLQEMGTAKPSEGWEQGIISWAKSQGVIAGDPDSSLRAKSYSTRAETAQMLQNFLESDALADKVEEIVEDVLENRE